MGRKNSNARRRYNGANYNSFAELKQAGIRFDLSDGDFIQKSKGGVRSSKETEISIRITEHRHGDKKDECLSVSIRADLGRKLGEYLKIGIVKFGLIERLYFLETDDNLGFKMSQNRQQNSSRFYVRFPLNDRIKPNYLKYLGEHNLKYDYENSAYYVVSHGNKGEAK